MPGAGGADQFEVAVVETVHRFVAVEVEITAAPEGVGLIHPDVNPAAAEVRAPEGEHAVEQIGGLRRAHHEFALGVAVAGIDPAAQELVEMTERLQRTDEFDAEGVGAVVHRADVGGGVAPPHETEGRHSLDFVDVDRVKHHEIAAEQRQPPRVALERLDGHHRAARTVEFDAESGEEAGLIGILAGEGEAEPETPAAPEKEYGVVAVCAGAGLESLFKDLGTDAVVTGGQTMNPSTDDILQAINRTPASTVFVFPNNKNIIMAAEQCIPLTDKRVIVMPTKTVPQGISALLNFNPDVSEESLVGAMGEAIGKVHTAMITYAARDSDFGGHAIHAGEYLALLDGALIGSYTNIKTLFKELSWAFDDYHPEFITIYYGEDVRQEEADAAAETITGNFPDAEVSVVSGGQPVYYYMISVE